MFKKPNRNFRRRRADSSEEDETNRTREGEVRGTQAVHVSAPARLSLHQQQGRGISCSSKRESESSKLASGKGDCTPENDVSEQTSEAATEQVETETVEHKLKTENKEKKKNKSVLSFVEDKGDIPDAQQIQAARRQRQLARAPKDFISLDTTRGNSPGVKDQEDGDSNNEPDDHERRIQFTPKPKTLRQRIAAKIGRSESEDEMTDSQEDDYQNLWEKQQIRKGTNIPQVGVKVKVPTARKMMIRICGRNNRSEKGQTSHRLESIGQVHRAHQREQEKIQQDIESTKTCLENLEDTSPCLRYKFYKEMRIYVQNLVDCLSEKIQMISDVESEMHHLLKHQAQAILNRRREEVKEESLYIQQLTNFTNSSNIGHMDSGKRNKCLVEQKERREIAAEVVVLLVTIKALDHADDIIREYQMEDLKTSLGIS
ncbi:UNVERIFIED_CONTAM: hypothetical protein FKN15_045442 [Acipenser sinensis]